MRQHYIGPEQRRLVSGLQTLDARALITTVLAVLDTNGARSVQVHDNIIVPLANFTSRLQSGSLNSPGRRLGGPSPARLQPPAPALRHALDLGPLGRALPLICYEAESFAPKQPHRPPHPTGCCKVTK